jgi:ribonuclease HI
MSNKKKSIYVVVNGRKPGIYSKWLGVGETAEQVEGFPEAVYKGFYTREEAINWLKEFPLETLLKLAPNLVEYLDERTDSSPTLAETIDELLKSEQVVIFTDGSANPNTGAGGYGVILKYKDKVKELSGGFRKTTNNRMEIIACIEGLRALKKKSDVVVFSDSQYVVNSISKGWAKKWQAQNWMRNNKEKAENIDLWAQLLELCNQHNVEFRWVKGHNGTKENERCDQLALEATQKRNLPADEGFENPRPSNPAPLFSAMES